MNPNVDFVGKRRRKNERFLNQSIGILAIATMIQFNDVQFARAAETVKGFQPDNIYARPPWLSLTMKRVAVLPVAAQSSDNDLPAGCEMLESVLNEELIKTKRFETVPVAADTLRRRTGSARWTGKETLPSDFFAFLQREYDCDGVLFCELTTYRAYSPLAVGWRLKLVDVKTGQVIWAADELFDAAEPAVAKAAQNFDVKRVMWPFWQQSDHWAALNSPRQFGRYAVAAVFKTIPEREIK